jgi:hypothetical protein
MSVSSLEIYVRDAPDSVVGEVVGHLCLGVLGFTPLDCEICASLALCGANARAA